MGGHLYDDHEKSYRAIASTSLSNLYDNKTVPALSKLQEALIENGSGKGQPTEISITIHGKKEYTFSFKVDDLSEIQEILQWSIGKD